MLLERMIDMNTYEREQTERFEGIYAPEEIDINRQLLEECVKPQIDFSMVEALLKKGADPLGPVEGAGWALLDHIYFDLIEELQEERSEELLSLTKLFLKYGMVLSGPRIEYDGSNSLHPMWLLGLMLEEKAMPLLELLLDNGMDEESFGECWGHITSDLINVTCGDPVHDEYWRDVCVWTMKAIMFGASYDHIINADADLREFIGLSRNDYDLHRFRRYNDFEYTFDTSLCWHGPEFYRSIVTIYDKNKGKEVWKTGICLKEGEI